MGVMETPSSHLVSLLKMHGPAHLPALSGLQADAQDRSITLGFENRTAIELGSIKGKSWRDGNKQLVDVPAHDPALAKQPATFPYNIDEVNAPAADMAVRRQDLGMSLAFPDAEDLAVEFRVDPSRLEGPAERAEESLAPEFKDEILTRLVQA
jgi:hypothetical protein